MNNEFITTVMEHLTSQGPIFSWWEIYAYWGTVCGIFLVDNILRMKYNKKLKEDYEHKKRMFELRHAASSLEIRRLKTEVDGFIVRDGGQGSVMDIKNYKVHLRSFSMSKKDPLKLDIKYESPNNYPTLKEEENKCH